MATRKVPLVTGEIYHLYNRGVDKRVIFANDSQYQRFLNTFLYYQSPHQLSFGHSQTYSKAGLSLEREKQNPLIQLLSFDLQPNHFHLLARQLIDGGISKFMHDVSTAYTTFFNTKNDRSGSLFQSTFKSVHITSDEHLLYVMRYIHINSVAANLVSKPEDWFWSSHLDYLGIRKPPLIDTQEILSYFPSRDAYQKYVNDQIDYAKHLTQIKSDLKI